MLLGYGLLLLLGSSVPGSASPVSSPTESGLLSQRSKPRPDIHRANAVIEAFRTSYAGYKKYAFGKDDLEPVSNSYENDRNGWGATAVDGLDTAILMRQKDIVNEILAFIRTIDFTTTAVANQSVSVFESNIRYIGGMLAAYDLLKGPFSDMLQHHEDLATLLRQSKTLADSLKVAFDTPSGVPDGEVIFNPTYMRTGGTTNNVAEAGTLVLEWTHLSDLTGDPQYAQLTQKAESYILKPTGSPEPWPGLLGTNLDLSDGTFQDSGGSWSGGMDSCYEYLIKAYMYDPGRFELNKDRWVLAADSTMAHLASHPTTKPHLTFLSGYSGQTTIPSSGHLASFAGGNFLLAGILLNEDKYKQFGLDLTNSYYATYTADATGIGPEGFQWGDDAAVPASAPPPADQARFYARSGFWITSGQYLLRPETVESLYYAYRATGDGAYQDKVWAAFEHITAATRVGSGYACLQDVNDRHGGLIDEMESFWLAEALKYMYLAFAEDSEVQFQAGGGNKFVFNTEAHPLRVRD